MADIISSTTQQFLDIHDITNNLVIMKDGTVSVIITVDAMNFGLLAEEEQDAVMYAYAGLLNSLNYPVQIVINSQTKDVTSYLQLLKDQEADASNDTIRKRIRLYREFVSNLIHERNVLDKKFYVVIPANAIELGLMGASTVLPGQNKFDITSIERSLLLEKALNILEPRRDHLIAQFARIGLYSRQLATQEIIQLFYVRYNPEATEGQQIAESSSYTSPLVEASVQGNYMMNDTTQSLGASQAYGQFSSPQPASNSTDAFQPAPGVGAPPMGAPLAAPVQTTPSPVDAMSNVLGTTTMNITPGTATTPVSSTAVSTTPASPASLATATPVSSPASVSTPSIPSAPFSTSATLSATDSLSPSAVFPAASIDPLSSMPPTVTAPTSSFGSTTTPTSTLTSTAVLTTSASNPETASLTPGSISLDPALVNTVPSTELPIEPPAEPQTMVASAPPTTQPIDEAAIQAGLDATLEQLGGSVPAPSASSDLSEDPVVSGQKNDTSDQNKIDDLPPLPEI